MSPIIDLINGFIETKVLMAAFELGVFDKTVGPGLGDDELLHAIDVPPRPGRSLLNACTALGLLERHSGRLRTPTALVPYLTRSGGEEYEITRYMLVEHYPSLYRKLDRFTEVLRSNGRSVDFVLDAYEPSYLAGGESAGFAHYLALSVPRIVDVILESYPFSQHRRVLDLFSGIGAACRHIVERTPGLRGVFMDLPTVVDSARPEMDAAGWVDGRLEGCGGDIFEAPWPNGVDLITIIRSAHDWEDDRITRVLKRAHDALPPGGVLLIAERMLPPPESDESRELALRDLGFLVILPGISYRTPDRYRELLREAGFDRVDVVTPTRDAFLFYRGMRLVIGTRR